jgi:asparagine synthase (glutamine-hydrolysing)
LPNPQDIVPLQELMRQGHVRPGDFIVNGQSGDFITGNHIPERLLNADVDVADVLDAIIEKHFALWRSLQTEENLVKIKGRILEVLGLKGDEIIGPQGAAALYEQWEYQERQAKFVVAGQRIYDFLGLSWRLPLWDQELIYLFRDLPARRKFGQAPYRAYLRQYDYKGLFQDFHRPVWHWPGAMKAVLPAARIIRLTKGRDARDRFLKKFLYFGNFRHHYAPFRYRDFVAHVDDLRSPISLLVAVWLKERGVSVPGLPEFATV